MVTGPTAVGKDTTLANLQELLVDNGVDSKRVKSWTTRTPRSGISDDEYHFVDNHTFLRWFIVIRC